MDGLARALSRLLNQDELTSRLAQVLPHASERGRVSYHEIGEIISTGDAVLIL